MCEIIEEMGRRNNNFFWVTTDEKAKVYQQVLAKLILESYDSADKGAAETGSGKQFLQNLINRECSIPQSRPPM